MAPEEHPPLQPTRALSPATTSSSTGAPTPPSKPTSIRVRGAHAISNNITAPANCEHLDDYGASLDLSQLARGIAVERGLQDLSLEVPASGDSVTNQPSAPNVSVIGAGISDAIRESDEREDTFLPALAAIKLNDDQQHTRNFSEQEDTFLPAFAGTKLNDDQQDNVEHDVQDQHSEQQGHENEWAEQNGEALGSEAYASGDDADSMPPLSESTDTNNPFDLEGAANALELPTLPSLGGHTRQHFV